MTKLFEDAVEKARALPSGMQDDIARLIETYAGAGLAVYEMSPEEEGSVGEAFAQIDRGELATEEQVQAVWARYGL